MLVEIIPQTIQIAVAINRFNADVVPAEGYIISSFQGI